MRLRKNKQVASEQLFNQSGSTDKINRLRRIPLNDSNILNQRTSSGCKGSLCGKNYTLNRKADDQAEIKHCALEESRRAESRARLGNGEQKKAADRLRRSSSTIGRRLRRSTVSKAKRQPPRRVRPRKRKQKRFGRRTPRSFQIDNYQKISDDLAESPLARGIIDSIRTGKDVEKNPPGLKRSARRRKAHRARRELDPLSSSAITFRKDREFRSWKNSRGYSNSVRYVMKKYSDGG